MSSRSLVCSIVLATLAATPLITVPQAAHAQGLIDFLWGGTDEWGGKRQVVDFDAKYSADQVIVSFGDRRLYLITQKGKAISYPIAVPREQSRWQGTTTVSEKKINPSWRPTPDMLKENPKLPTWVPGGHPMNPLGVRAMYLGASTYRIHGTDAPWTIGQAVSKGCIRMYNEDVEDLYPRVPVGMKVTVTWQQFNGQAVAANDGATPPPFDPSPVSYGTSSKASRTIRNLPPPPSSLPSDTVGAANKMAPPEPLTEDKPKPVAKAKAPKATLPAIATTVASTSATAPSPAAAPAAPASAAAATPPPAATPVKAEPSDPVAAANKAAEAATRAAQSARAAAEAAKKAAADAQKATSADSDETGKDDAAKRAAL